jgi:phage terminase large subunit
MPKKVIDLNLNGIKALVNPSFWPLMLDKNKFVVMRGGAGSGKSWFCAQKIVFRVLLGMGAGLEHHFLVLRKTATASRDSTFKLFKDLIKQWGLYKNDEVGKDICYVKEKEMRIVFENGSTITCAGLDDPEKIKSIHNITGIWMEETTQFDREDLYQLDLRLRGEKPTYFQILLSFNPIDKNHWVYSEFFKENRPEATLHHSTYKDNKWIGAEYEEKLNLYSKNPYWYTVYCLGEWGVFEGVVYRNWKVIHPEDWPLLKKTSLGLDFGYNEPTVLLEVGKMGDALYIHEHIYRSNLVVDELVEELKNTILMNGKHINSDIPIYCDNNEPSTIQFIKRQGYNAITVEKGRNTVKEGIKHVQAHQLLITNVSENTIREIQGYRYKEGPDGPDGKTYLDDPIAINDHSMSALRYVCWMEHVRPKRIYGVYTVMAGA